MPYSFYFGGTSDDPTGTEMKYLGGPDYGITLNLEEQDLLISCFADVQSAPAGYAASSYGMGHSPKTLIAPCIMKGDSWRAVKRQIRNLNYLLSKNRLAALRFDDIDVDLWDNTTITSLYWLVRLTGRTRPKIYGNGLTFELEFTAPDPRAYGVTEITQIVNLTSGTNSFNVPASGTLDGNAEPDVTWLIKPSGSGATNPLALRNTTRDETLTWNNTLTTAEWLRVKAFAHPQIVEKTGDSGASYTTSNGSLSAGSRFPKLSPGVANACQLTGCAGTGTLEISYRPRFE